MTLRAVLCLVLLIPFAFLSPANATVIVVATVSDAIAVDNRCTLREAIQAANTDTQVDTCPAGFGEDVIELFFTSEHVLSLAGTGEDQNQTGDLDIRDDVIIRPADPGVIVTINAAGIDRVFEVFDGANLTLERIRVVGGDVIGFGGGILGLQPTSRITLSSSQIVNNSASLFGGGVFSEGALDLVDTTIENNDAIFGGGIFMGTDEPLTLLRSDIRSNDASSDGGGINALVIEVEDSSIGNNDAGRHGGGIAFRVESGMPPFGQITNSTIAENGAAEHGGGIYKDGLGSLEIYNSTIAWNAADTDQDNNGDGGGLFVNSGTVQLLSSIIGSNLDLSQTRGVDFAPDCRGPINSQGYNLLASIDATDCPITGDTTGNITGSIASPVEPALDCLGNYGGPTRSVPPTDSSPAVDAGHILGCTDADGMALQLDQRAHLRPWDGPDPDTNARCDIGSVELGAPSITVVFMDNFESGDTSAWSPGSFQATLLKRGGGGGDCVDPERRWSHLVGR